MPAESQPAFRRRAAARTLYAPFRHRRFGVFPQAAEQREATARIPRLLVSRRTAAYAAAQRIRQNAKEAAALRHRHNEMQPRKMQPP